MGTKAGSSGDDPLSAAQFLAEFRENPRSLLKYPPSVVALADPEELDSIKLEIARRAFSSGVEQIRMVRQLAEASGVSRIETVDDLVPLFYSHETFKSYPQSWLEASDFQRLTKWVAKLCAADVSSVDARSCELIEEWMSVLRDQSTIDLQISAGADGKAAFMPRSATEWQVINDSHLRHLQTATGPDGEPIGLRPGVDRVPLIYLGARKGARTLSRFLDFYEFTFGDGLVDTLFEHRDSDLLSLAGRVREASKKGEAGLLQIQPQLLARKSEIARLNEDREARTESFTRHLIEEYRGRRIICRGTMQDLYDLAMRIRDLGIVGGFAPDSLFFCGGGFADGVEPENWRTDVAEILGIPPSSIQAMYGMQEALWVMYQCRSGHFHIPTTITPYVLDESTDQPLPRTGRQSGRFAFFDLLTDTSWGGFVTGDHVSITWEGGCSCGTRGPFLDGSITKVRTSESDKISCAGTAGALEEATDFILNN